MYKAPVDDILSALNAAADFSVAPAAGRWGDLTPDVLRAIVEEAGRFAGEEIAPLAMPGDRQGARWHDGEVTMPDGWKSLYARWTAGGWNALTGPEAFGGQSLPTVLSAALFELWNGASVAFGVGPMLTIGAIDAIGSHATPALRSLYLPKLVSGEWMGTMNLTEPQSGSDLSGLRTRAERREDGSYRIFGTKIYITFGEHDLTDNIVHLVLARLPDAPSGVRGLSLFLVPKRLVNGDGTPGARNDVRCLSAEHKLGIHASPTCTMIFGDGFGETGESGAVGWLVGEENRGLACMFTMMNASRLYVGVQGLGVAQAAYQKAHEFARERRQGRSLARTAEAAGGEMVPILEHPDVARMLLTMKALTAGARAICYACAHAIDMSRVSDGEEKLFWSERANLLTPIAKSFPTDVGVAVASLGIQVHGGMGYVEETGAAQLLRDARIAPIYEGTNGIQAIDLVTRKLPLSDGRAVTLLINEFGAVADRARATGHDPLAHSGEQLQSAVVDLRVTTAFLLDALRARSVDVALAGATSYQRLFALVAACAYLVRAALAVSSADAEKPAALARFAVDHILTEVSALKAQVMHGAAGLEAGRAALR